MLLANTAQELWVIPHRTNQGWDIIFQRAHALLAAKLITYWRGDQRPERWTETLNATAQHDNGWQEWEAGHPLSAEGEPLHFSQTPLGETVLQAERALTRAWHQSRWMGLLISHHISHLYEPQRSKLRAMDELLDDQPRLRAAWRESLGVTAPEVQRAYALLLWGDTLSLLLCQGQLAPDGGETPIGTGPDGTAYCAARRGGEIVITPWPFERPSFRASVDVHHVPGHTFENEDALAAALQRTPITALTWEICSPARGTA